MGIALTPLGLRVRGYPKGVRGLRWGWYGVRALDRALINTLPLLQGG